MFYVYLTGLLLIAGKPAREDAAKILEKVGQTYSSERNFTIKARYHVFEQNLDGEVLDTREMIYKQFDRQSFYSEYDQVKSFGFTNQLLIVDQDHKTMLITTNSGQHGMADYESIMQSLSKAKDVVLDNYRITMHYERNSGSAYSKVILEYDPQKFLLKKMFLYPFQKVEKFTNNNTSVFVNAVVKIEFSDFKTGSVQKEDVDYKQFIYKNGGRFFPTKPFEKYSLIQ